MWSCSVHFIGCSVPVMARWKVPRNMKVLFGNELFKIGSLAQKESHLMRPREEIISGENMVVLLSRT